VVIDYELKNDIAASGFRLRFITLDLNEGAAPESVVMELTNLFRKGPEFGAITPGTNLRSPVSKS